MRRNNQFSSSVDPIPPDVEEGPKDSMTQTFSVIGIVVIIIGIILIIAGLMTYSSAQSIDTTSKEDDPFFGDFEKTDFDKASEKNNKEFSGIAMTMFGIFLSFAGVSAVLGMRFRRRISSYSGPVYRDPYRQAAPYSRKSITSGSSHPGDVIKVKCQNCGYLDSEDADFCSKCGTRL